jgi:RNA polymerase sigma-70 factor (ECF subfamily)
VIVVSTLGSGAREAALAGADDAAACRAVEAGTATMDEQEFQAFYRRTAHRLHTYLTSASRDAVLADDLLQESYYRLLRSGFQATDDTHRRNYLFRIASNLLRDHYRRRRPQTDELPELAGHAHEADRPGLRSDMARAMGELAPRDRQMLWLAYVEGFSHQEIGQALGLRTASLRPMLFRARERLAAALRAGGFGS